MFEKFAEASPVVWASVGALAVLGILLSVLTRGRRRVTTRALVLGAMCVTLGFVLSFISLWHLPQGGSLTAASMLPVMVFGWLFGPIWGLLAGLVYSVLQMIQEFWFVHPVQVLLDYVLAFMVLGLAGLMPMKKHPKLGLMVGIAIAGVLRYSCHVVSGVVYYYQYAYEAGLNPWVYSMGYNIFVLVELLLCEGIVSVPQVYRALAAQKRKLADPGIRG